MSTAINEITSKTQTNEPKQPDLKTIYLVMIRAYLRRYPLESIPKEKSYD